MDTQLRPPEVGHPSPDGFLSRMTSAAARLPWTAIALVWIGVYTVVRVVWAAGFAPDADRLSPTGGDLLLDGWPSVGVCAAALVAVVASAVVPPTGWRGHVTAAFGWATALALAALAALLMLDVIGGLLPGLGIEFFPLGAASRATCAVAAVLVGLVTLRYHRRLGLLRARPLDTVPGWAYAAAYLAVAGAMVRIGAQLWVGLDETPLAEGAATVVFEVGFLLGGTLLPLAQVHRFGRVWPRWVPFLRGRTVPRGLVLWPGMAIGAGISVYFGLMTAMMIWERLNGRNPFPPTDDFALPETFFWISVPAYLVWGLGLTFAARAYSRRTRRRGARR